MSTWGYPTQPLLLFQVNGTAQASVTTLNAPAGSTVSNGVLTIAGSSTPSAGTSPFAIGTNLVLSATGLTAARTFTWPDATDTVVTLAATQVLASKTMTAPVVNGLTSSGSTAIDFSGNSGTWKPPTGGLAAQLALQADNTFAIGATGAKLSRVFAYNFYGTTQTVAAASSLTLNPASGEHIRLTLSGTAITAITVSAGGPAEILTVEVIEDATGSRTIPTTWTNVKFAGGTYVATTTLSKRDVLTFRYDATDSAWVEVSRAMNL